MMDKNSYYKIAFASLKLDGRNLDEFFNRRYDKFRLWTSELPTGDKIQAVLSGQINGQTEIEIEKDLSVKTFIETEVIDFQKILNESLDPELRQKINLWVDYLRNRKTDLLTISQNIKITQPLVALECFYLDKQVNEGNFSDIAKKRGCTNSSQLVREYNRYQSTNNRVFNNLDELEIKKATEQKKRLENLRTLWENEGKTKLTEYNKPLSDLNSDIQLITRNIENIG